MGPSKHMIFAPLPGMQVMMYFSNAWDTDGDAVPTDIAFLLQVLLMHCANTMVGWQACCVWPGMVFEYDMHHKQAHTVIVPAAILLLHHDMCPSDYCGCNLEIYSDLIGTGFLHCCA